MTLALYTCAAACAAGPPRRPTIAPSTTALVERAQNAERARRYDEARALYQQATADAPDAASRAWAAREQAEALVFWGEYEAAERALEIAVTARPDDAASWHDLGMLRHRRGDTAAAEQAFRRSMRAAPRDARPRIALAALLVNAGRFDDAIAEYEALLELDLPPRTRDAVHRALDMLRAERRR